MLLYFTIVLCRTITSLFLLHPELLCVALLWCVRVNLLRVSCKESTIPCNIVVWYFVQHVIGSVSALLFVAVLSRARVHC